MLNDTRDQILFTQNTLLMNEYFPGFQPRYVEGMGQVLIGVVVRRLNLVIRADDDVSS